MGNQQVGLKSSASRRCTTRTINNIKLGYSGDHGSEATFQPDRHTISFHASAPLPMHREHYHLPIHFYPPSVTFFWVFSYYLKNPKTNPPSFHRASLPRAKNINMGDRYAQEFAETGNSKRNLEDFFFVRQVFSSYRHLGFSMPSCYSQMTLPRTTFHCLS